VGATIIAATSSIKNAGGTRDPDMHQAKKGNQWHFGMKALIGVDAESGLVHAVVGTAANVNDVTQAGALPHYQEAVAFGHAGYRGVHKREEAQGPQWHVAMQPGQRRRLDLAHEWARLLERAEQFKASVRAKVEHPFHVIKNLFRHRKVRYKGLAKNDAQLLSLSGRPTSSSPSGCCWRSTLLGHRPVVTKASPISPRGRRCEFCLVFFHRKIPQRQWISSAGL
jgi:IS5 family transposase